MVTGKSIGFLALRLLSVYLFIQSLSWASNLFGFVYVSNSAIANGPGLTGLMIFSLGPPLLFLLSSLFLWFRADKIVGYFIVNDDSEQSGYRNSRSFFEMALMVAGIIIVAVSIPELFSVGHNTLVIGIDPVMNNPKVRYEIGFGIAELLSKLALGGLLIFRSKAIMARVEKWRNRE